MEPKRLFYSQYEKNLLSELVSKHLSQQVGSKKRDVLSPVERSQYWDKIGEEFNANSRKIQQVTVRQLKKLWENMKANAKKQVLNNTTVKAEKVSSPPDSPATPDEQQADNSRLECSATEGQEPECQPAYEHNDREIVSLTNQSLKSYQELKLVEAKERIRRVREQIRDDQELHELVMEEQRLKIEFIKRKIEGEEAKLAHKKAKLAVEKPQNKPK